MPDVPDAPVEDPDDTQKAQVKLDDPEAPPVGFDECMVAYEPRYSDTGADDQQRRMYCRLIAEVTTLAATSDAIRPSYVSCLGGRHTLPKRFACGLAKVSNQALCQAFADGHAACVQSQKFRNCISNPIKNGIKSASSPNLAQLVPLFRKQRNARIAKCQNQQPTSAQLGSDRSQSYWLQNGKKQQFSLPVATPALTPNEPATLIVRMQDKTGAALPTPVAVVGHRRTKEAMVLKGKFNGTKRQWEFKFPASMMSKGLFLVTQIGMQIRRNHPTFADNDLLSCEQLNTCPPPLEKVSQVWVAQTHVQGLLGRDFSPGSPEARLGFGTNTPWVKLVGGRDTMVKIDASAAQGGLPVFMAALYRDGQTQPEEVVVFDPAVDYPTAPLTKTLGQNVHSHANSFRAIIPGKYIARGYRMQIVIATYSGVDLKTLPTPQGSVSGEFRFGYDASGSNDNIIHVSAPTTLPLNVFEIRFPNPTNTSATIPDVSEFAAQLPARDVRVQRIAAPDFDKIVLDTPQGPRVVGLEAQTVRLDGDVAFLAGITRALQAAAGQTFRSIYAGVGYDPGHLFSGQNGGKGTPTGFRGVAVYPGNLVGNDAVLFHEWSHALNAAHPDDSVDYTFRNSMYGIAGTTAHMGPIWGYLPPRVSFAGQTSADARYGTFVDPVKNRGASGAAWRETPLTVGLNEDILPGRVMKHFSFLETRVMQSNLERDQIGWGPGSTGTYFWHHWDDAANQYGRTVSGALRVQGRDVPRDREEQDVVSVVFSAWQPSGGGAGAHVVYPPIGPYKSTLIDLVDPTQSRDNAYCQWPADANIGTTCDYTLRISREGMDPKLYMVRAAARRKAGNPYDYVDWLEHAALNVPAAPPITKVELLYTPNVGVNPLPSSLAVKASWTRP